MRIIFVSIFLFFLISCVKEKSKKIDIKNVEIIENSQEEKVEDKELTSININVEDIKRQLDNVVTTFLSKNEIGFFENKIKNNFFGSYTLIKNDLSGLPTKRVGNLIIYDSINPYKYDKKTEEFIELNLFDKGIIINEKIEVGISYKKLINILGDKYEFKTHTLIFRSKNKIGFFKIKDSIVDKIKIGIYRDNVNEEDLLKKSNW